MSEKKVLIIGAGKRMQAAALPVLEKLKGRYTIHRIFDKTEMKIRSRESEYETGSLERIGRDDISEADLVYMAVNKDKVPGVLKKLSRFDLSRADLLTETPVLLFKHFCFVDLLKRFRNAWVAEDCTRLPCYDVIRDALEGGLIGELRRVEFHQSAYKYHGLAALKTWLNCTRISSARKGKMDRGLERRDLKFANGTSGRMYEPRDYGTGRFVVAGDKGSISDGASDSKDEHLLEPMVEGGSCRGFRIGEMTTALNEDEMDLMGTMETGARATSIMDPMKRVGFYRMLKGMAEGDGGYSAREALDDMVIDYYLDKVRFFRGNPVMSVKSKIGHLLLKTVSRIMCRIR